MDVHPLNGSSVEYVDDRDLSSGQIFYRRKINTDLRFGGHKYKDEYDYFWRIFRASGANAIGRCGEIRIRHQEKCDGRWNTLWTGVFSVARGRFERSRCVFSIKPDPVDRYACIMRRMDTKYNVLEQDSETLDVPIMASLDISISATDLTGTQDYELATSVVDDFGCTIYVNWRESVRMPCASGSPSAPGTPGWTLRSNYCSSNGYAIYTRAPTIAWTFGDPVAGSWATFVDDAFGGYGADPVPPDNTCDWYLGGGEGFTNPGYSVGCYDGISGTAYERNKPWYLCRPVYSIVADTETFSRARDFAEALDAMYAPCGGTVVSDFLEINPVGDAVGYISGDNYVTGEDNKVANLKLVQMSDAVSQTSNPATIGNLTLKEILLLLQSMRLYWDIDDNGDLRIEHWTYWQSVAGIDVRAKKNTEADAFLALDENPPRAEICTWVFAKGPDFVGKDITYSPPCASEDDTTSKKYDFKPFVTDLPTIIQTRATNTFNITKEGFLVIACEAGTNDVAVENGAITSNAAANMHLSWANLHDHYWRNDRLLPSGNMNGVDTDFDGFVPNIRQDEFGVDMCCAMRYFNPRDRVTCNLSQSLKSQTQVKRAIYNPSTGWLKLTLLHAYD
jgi:hypothetical protein